jgi:NAD(P)-dependent dehydrogenase (short-subunit alcohol dehydrogenase family)
MSPGCAIVTGGSRDLGLGIALAETGRPVVIAVRDPQDLRNAAAELEAKGADVGGSERRSGPPLSHEAPGNTGASRCLGPVDRSGVATNLPPIVGHAWCPYRHLFGPIPLGVNS